MEQIVRFSPKSAGGGTVTSCPFPVGFGGFFKDNPNTIYAGTTWEQKKDVFILAAGDKYAAGSTGGEAEHKLTQAEIPNYYIGDIAAPVPGVHANWGNNGVHASNMGEISSNKTGITGNDAFSGIQWSWRIESNGGGQAHNNLPPYFAMPFWVRTA